MVVSRPRAVNFTRAVLSAWSSGGHSRDGLIHFQVAEFTCGNGVLRCLWLLGFKERGRMVEEPNFQ